MLKRNSNKDDLPPTPSRPRLTRLSNTSATLTWSFPKDINIPENIIGFDIAVSVSGGNWTLLEKNYEVTTYTAKIKPGVPHIYNIRSVDGDGQTSLPSPWSPLVIGGKGSTHPELESPLVKSLLNLTSVSPHSPSELKITWQVS